MKLAANASSNLIIHFRFPLDTSEEMEGLEGIYPSQIPAPVNYNLLLTKPPPLTPPVHYPPFTKRVMYREAKVKVLTTRPNIWPTARGGKNSKRKNVVILPCAGLGC